MLYIRKLFDVSTGMETNVGVWANVVIIINRTKVVIIFRIVHVFQKRNYYAPGRRPIRRMIHIRFSHPKVRDAAGWAGNRKSIILAGVRRG